MDKKRILMARKPEGIRDIKKQTTGKITPAEITEIVKKNDVKEASFQSWNDLQKADLSGHQFWKVQLVDEDELLLIDTSGYDYPRYVGFIERRSDGVPLREKLDDYREHYFVMMNDLSKDELIQQLWDLKPTNEKVKEATEFLRVFDE